MRTKIKLYFILFIIGIISSAGFSSCDDSNDWDVDGSHDRLFSPIDLQASVDGTQVVFGFKKTYQSNLSYMLEISQDSLVFGNIVYGPVEIEPVAVPNDNSVLSYKLVSGTLKPNKQYSARIRCFREGSNESIWSAVAFKTSSEQILKPINGDKLTDKSVVVEWIIPNAVTHFMFGPKNGTLTRYDISTEEKASGSKIFAGLSASTEYVATIYNGNTEDDIRGSRTFLTPDPLPDGNIYVLKPGDNLSAIIAAQTEDISIVFPKQSVYRITEATVIPENINITLWGQGAVKPQLYVNVTMDLPSKGKTLTFENLEIMGTKEDGSTLYEYVINNSKTTTMEGVVFKNCIMKNFKNAILRLQSAADQEIKNLVVDNCVVSNIGDNGGAGTYAFFHIQAGKANNIQISNSTMSKIGYSLLLHNSKPSESLTIQNCTFYNIVGDGRLFIDYNAQSAGTFTLRNIILSKSLSPAGTSKGIRATNKPTVVNSYQASDFIASTNKIDGIVDYPGTATTLFKDPANADFTIIDNSFEGKGSAGDPRWNK